MSGSWGASMQSAAASTLAHPGWWVMALAGFLVRGGFLVVLLPIVSLPSTASLTTFLAPPLEALILGRPSLEGAIVGTIIVSLVLVGLAAAGFAGSWLDLALAREAAADEELELAWTPARGGALRAFLARILSHTPTLVAVGYSAIRLIPATYDELLAPGDAALPMAARVILRAPDAVIVVVVAWFLAETAGGLATRHVAAGEPVGSAIRRSFRALVGRRALATQLVTTAILVGTTVPFLLAAGRAWERLRIYLIEGVTPVELGAALVLLVGTWVLGLAVLGGALAWRATAWSIILVTHRTGAPEPEPGAVGAHEVVAS